MDYLVKDTDMAVVADAIRSKGGTSEPLTFPDGMVAAITAITGGGGDDSQWENMILKGRGGVIEIHSDQATKIGNGTFKEFAGVKSVYFPKVQSIGSNAFRACYSLTEVTFPLAEIVGYDCFYQDSNLKIGRFPSLKTLDAYSFESCGSLETLVLNNSIVVNLKNTNAFRGTKIASGAGYIYVPKALVEQYKVATNWATFANQIRAIEDYPEITGG